MGAHGYWARWRETPLRAGVQRCWLEIDQLQVDPRWPCDPALAALLEAFNSLGEVPCIYLPADEVARLCQGIVTAVDVRGLATVWNEDGRRELEPPRFQATVMLVGEVTLAQREPIVPPEAQ